VDVSGRVRREVWVTGVVQGVGFRPFVHAAATALGLAVLIGLAAILLGFPGAHWTLATFAIAFLPGLVLTAAISAIGERRA